MTITDKERRELCEKVRSYHGFGTELIRRTGFSKVYIQKQMNGSVKMTRSLLTALIEVAKLADKEEEKLKAAVQSVIGNQEQ